MNYQKLLPHLCRALTAYTEPASSGSWGHRYVYYTAPYHGDYAKVINKWLRNDIRSVKIVLVCFGLENEGEQIERSDSN